MTPEASAAAGGRIDAPPQQRKYAENVALTAVSGAALGALMAYVQDHGTPHQSSQCRALADALDAHPSTASPPPPPDWAALRRALRVVAGEFLWRHAVHHWKAAVAPKMGVPISLSDEAVRARTPSPSPPPPTMREEEGVALDDGGEARMRRNGRRRSRLGETDAECGGSTAMPPEGYLSFGDFVLDGSATFFEERLESDGEQASPLLTYNDEKDLGEILRSNDNIEEKKGTGKEKEVETTTAATAADDGIDEDGGVDDTKDGEGYDNGPAPASTKKHGSLPLRKRKRKTRYPPPETGDEARDGGDGANTTVAERTAPPLENVGGEESGKEEGPQEQSGAGCDKHAPPEMDEAATSETPLVGDTERVLPRRGRVRRLLVNGESSATDGRYDTGLLTQGHDPSPVGSRKGGGNLQKDPPSVDGGREKCLEDQSAILHGKNADGGF